MFLHFSTNVWVKLLALSLSLSRALNKRASQRAFLSISISEAPPWTVWAGCWQQAAGVGEVVANDCFGLWLSWSPLIHYLLGMRGTQKRMVNNAFHSLWSLYPSIRFHFGGENGTGTQVKKLPIFLSLTVVRTWLNLGQQAHSFFPFLDCLLESSCVPRPGLGVRYLVGTAFGWRWRVKNTKVAGEMARSASKELAAQSWGPEFNLHHLLIKQAVGVVMHACGPCAGEAEAGGYQGGQLTSGFHRYAHVMLILCGCTPLCTLIGTTMCTRVGTPPTPKPYHAKELYK